MDNKYQIKIEKMSKEEQKKEEITNNTFLNNFLDDGAIRADYAVHELVKNYYFNYITFNNEEILNDEVLYYSFISETDSKYLEPYLNDLGAYIIRFEELNIYILCETVNTYSTLYTVEEGNLQILK